MSIKDRIEKLEEEVNDLRNHFDGSVLDGPRRDRINALLREIDELRATPDNPAQP